MSAIRSQVFALLAALVLALPLGVVARPSYLCRMSGLISRSCCCAGDHEPNAAAEVTRTSCCDLVAAVQLSAATAEKARTLVALAVVAVLDVRVRAFEAGERELPRRPQQFTRPPGPPRYLTHCSFLI